jgi:RHS repeat-associated protein
VALPGCLPSWPDANGFLGKPADTTTALTTLGARQYDPATGQFLSVDPVLNTAAPQTMAGYTYAAGNPATTADPTGLCPSTLCGGIPQPGAPHHRLPATNYTPCTIGCGYWPAAGQLRYMRNLGYQGSSTASPTEIANWLAGTSHSITNPNGAWDYFCQGLAGRSQCGSNPFNGNTNIYDSGIRQLFTLRGLAGFAGIAYAVGMAFSPAFGAPEIGVGADLGTGALAAAAEDAPAMSQMARVGSGLKSDLFHRSVSWVVDNPAAQRFTITGGDGVARDLYQLPGELNGKPGVFEWIVDRSGTDPMIPHQRFIPGGSVTGWPNQ